MASIDFYGGTSHSNQLLSGSGIGFYGGSFGQSVELNQWQDTTFITSSDGTVQGPSCNNIKYSTDTLAFAPSIVPATGLKYIPNEKASLNIRFTHSSTVRVQNPYLYVYDRINTNNPASGVLTRVVELLHESALFTVEGSGDDKWWGSSTHTGSDAKGTFPGSPNQSERLATGTNTVGGSGIYVPLANSPGPTGSWSGDGSASTYSATQHDWYIALSASPDSIGSKTQYGLYVSLEYL